MNEKLFRKIITGVLLLAAIVFLICCIVFGDTQLLIAIVCVLVTAVTFYSEMTKK